MTSFVELGLGAIAAFTLLTAVTIVMQAKERIHAGRQAAWLSAQRESTAAAVRANRDLTRAITNNLEEDDA